MDFGDQQTGCISKNTLNCAQIPQMAPAPHVQHGAPSIAAEQPKIDFPQAVFRIPHAKIHFPAPKVHCPAICINIPHPNITIPGPIVNQQAATFKFGTPQVFFPGSKISVPPARVTYFQPPSNDFCAPLPLPLSAGDIPKARSAVTTNPGSDSVIQESQLDGNVNVEVLGADECGPQSEYYDDE